MYGDLLDFYFESLKILRSRHFAASLTRMAMKQDNPLAEAVSSFSGHTESLTQHINVEIFSTTQSIRNDHVDDLGSSLLASPLYL